MNNKRVRVGKKYKLSLVPFDQFNQPFGMIEGWLKDGDEVKVINLFGCPKANTMGMCYISKNGEFAGMVMTNSLVDIEKK
jgi:hypothetical protein